jgi:hypothetical protein
VLKNAEVQLSDVGSVAVLNFGGTFSQRELGPLFAHHLAAGLQERSRYRIIPPEEAAAALAGSRFLPSQFLEPAVVSEAGRVLRADALLFGDVQTLEIQRSIKRETESRQTGVRQETAEKTGDDGKKRRVTYTVPVFQPYWRDQIRRTLVFQAEARLVRTRDHAVLWQEQVHWTGHSLAEEEENGSRRGDGSSDEAFRNLHLHQAALSLLAKVLPSQVARIRLLAVPGEEGPYSDWVMEGNQAAVAGNWEQAGAAWLKAASLDRDRPEARANLGVFWERQGDFQQALNEYAYAATRLKNPWKIYHREVQHLLHSK